LQCAARRFARFLGRSWPASATIIGSGQLRIVLRRRSLRRPAPGPGAGWGHETVTPDQSFVHQARPFGNIDASMLGATMTSSGKVRTPSLVGSRPGKGAPYASAFRIGQIGVPRFTGAATSYRAGCAHRPCHWSKRAPGITPVSMACAFHDASGRSNVVRACPSGLSAQQAAPRPGRRA